MSSFEQIGANCARSRFTMSTDTIANLAVTTNITIDDNVRRKFRKDTAFANNACVSQDVGNLRRRTDGGALPARGGYVPKRIAADRKVHSRHLYRHKPCAYGWIAKIVGPRVAVGRTAHMIRQLTSQLGELRAAIMQPCKKIRDSCFTAPLKISPPSHSV